ncbi:hypothetical protein ACLB1G_18565 [Oxalobacteraceae bacterium A2-2]
MRRLLLLAALGPAAVHAAPPAGKAQQQREASAAEAASFEQYYQSAYPGQPMGRPAITAERIQGGAWRLVARVNGAPQRYAGSLCRMEQRNYGYDPKAPAAQRWHPDGPPDHYVWMAPGATPCSAPAEAVWLGQGIPPEDVLSLLQQHGELLARARLLFAGNTSCARVRSLNFTLASLATAPPASGAMVMYAMEFQSDRGSRARVYVRKARAQFTAWNVDCSV